MAEEITISRLSYLEKKLEEAENNLYTSATYGKQLLEQNHDLHQKYEEAIKIEGRVEILEQEKHALKLKVDNQTICEKNLQQELEFVKEQLAKAQQQTEVKSLTKKNKDQEIIIEGLKLEITSNEELLKDLQNKLVEAKEYVPVYNNISVHELSTNDLDLTLQIQNNTLIQEKQALESSLVCAKADLSKCEKKLSLANRQIEELQRQLDEKECQLTSEFNASEKNKEELIDLQLQLEQLQFDRIDPSKKGNSIFSEVEDNRKLLEDKVAKLKINYDLIKKQYDLKTQHNHNLKIQLASLISVNSTKVDVGYISSLEQTIESFRQQVVPLKQRCVQLEEKLASAVATDRHPVINETDKTLARYFETKFQESEKSVKELEKEVQSLLFTRVALNDRILQLERDCHIAEAAKSQVYSENIILKVRVDELMNQKGIVPEVKEVKKFVEKLDFFKKPENLSNADSDKSSVNLPLKENPSNFGDKSDLKNNADLLNDNVTPSSNVDNKENIKEVSTNVLSKEKKIKKSVKMIDTVDVKDGDGKTFSATLRESEGHEKPKKTLKKLVAPKPVEGGITADDCKQQ